MLFNCAEEKAVKYVRSMNNKVSKTGDVFQLVLLNLLRKMCKSNPNEKSKFLRLISSLLESKSLAVLYQCAGTLVSISSSPAAIKGASNTYIQLLLKSNDNNIKLIVLDRLEELQNRYETLLSEFSMDILRGLNNSTMEIRKKVLKLSLESVTNKNSHNILTSLKKEMLSLGDDEKNGNYKQLIVKSIHQLITKFGDVSENSLFLLDFIGDHNCCIDVILLIREIIESNKNLTSTILKKLNDEFLNINSIRVFGIVLWIMGDFSVSKEELLLSFSTIKDTIMNTKKKEKTNEIVINNDGTYQSNIKKNIDIDCFKFLYARHFNYK